MLDCRQASHLISQSMETKLRLRQRLVLRLHLMMCDACTQFSRQLVVLRSALGRLHGNVENDGALRLSDQARRRIIQAVAERARPSGKR